MWKTMKSVQHLLSKNICCGMSHILSKKTQHELSKSKYSHSELIIEGMF